MTAFAATHHFVAYWANNGQRSTRKLNRYAAFDPKRTSQGLRSRLQNPIVITCVQLSDRERHEAELR
jgi:hypothetical protein